jgi:primosomal protein N' (replication factor Y)
MTTEKALILRIVLPVPLRRHFDYLAPLGCDITCLQPGMRVRVPFQSRELTGIFIKTVTESDAPLAKLKFISEVIDKTAVIPEDILQLCQWAADYYHFPMGEVLINALPGLLRQGKPTDYTNEIYYQLTDLGRHVDIATLKRAKKQIDTLKLFAQHPEGLSAKQLRFYKIPKTIVTLLLEKKFISVSQKKLFGTTENHAIGKNLNLNSAQQTALDVIRSANNKFQIFLLDGVTGSGKTEVYLQAITDVLAQDKQVLVLVPEIGLTPQTLQRFRERFSVTVIALHSGLSEKERLNAWLSAKSSNAKIIIGTRSAVFSPFENLGLIIVDEEHDLSFKQQEGFRYHARDVAIMRAHFKNIPIILGSATPALETLQKAQRGRYQHLILPERAGVAQLPYFKILDIRKISLEQGLSPSLLNEMKKHLDADNQVMLFLNRRGFAPVLLCHSCGWIALCKRCDIRMTYHHHAAHLHCHHCDSRKRIPMQCEVCHEKNLTMIGLGTERLEMILQRHFPDIAIARIDRDSTQGKGKMEELLNDIQQNKYRILIGTQMLAKGHHFPNVTLVAIVDADSGFFSSDFRAIERMGQLILQVSGRAGRVEKPGTVMIQTHHPEHPLLHQLIHENYRIFADTLLAEREQALLPPFSFFALFRAEAHDTHHAQDFLLDIKKLALSIANDIQLLGPISAPMPKRAGRHRSQLLLQTIQRPLLQQFLKTLIPEIEKIPGKQRVRWSLDVDPLEMF